MHQTEIRKEAIKRALKKLGPGFLDDPIFNASGVAQEVVDDMEAEIRKELNPKKKMRGQRAMRRLPSRGRR